MDQETKDWLVKLTETVNLHEEKLALLEKLVEKSLLQRRGEDSET